MADESRLLSIEQVGVLWGVNERRARQILIENLVTPVTGYREDSVRAISFRREHPPTLADVLVDPGFAVVPSDAVLPDTLIHEATGWQVHPALGMVYSIFPTRAPQLLGGVKNGHLVAGRKYQDGTRREWRLSRVIWEAVNRRSIPDGWNMAHRNENRLDNRYPNLRIEPSSETIERNINQHARSGTDG
ncbi:HNH endonuclease (plasmid) [Nocardia sp. CA-084685]|uniref:HNH endonuclease n=1 Tax=Nocardia sp. CA-084685 TaxID=3239970 RepID=UPI003D99EA63